MKISQFEEVQKLYRIRNKLKKSIKETRENLSVLANATPDSGGVGEDFLFGYNCHLSEYNDGSGSGVDLNGCYVALEVYEATLDILVDKLEKCEDMLYHTYDIEIDVEPEFLETFENWVEGGH